MNLSYKTEISEIGIIQEAQLSSPLTREKVLNSKIELGLPVMVPHHVF